MRLADGAEAIRGDLPSGATTVVGVPLGAGSDEGTPVRRLSAIAATRDALALELAASTGVPIVIGGDCGVELAAVPAAVRPDTAVLWFDAHPDLNTPDSSPSGAFGGMVLRTLLGEGAEALRPASPILGATVVIVGARAIDDGELEYLEASNIRLLTPDVATPAALAEALAATGATSLYVHIDVDVLDPGELEGVSDPVPFGLDLSTLLQLIGTARANLPLVGAGIAGFAPASPDAAVDDLGSILRIVGALAS
jgi:arginase